MVADKRTCLGCGKPVPHGMRQRLSKHGWTFLEFHEGDFVTYQSNCGCMTHDEFVCKCHLLHDDEAEKMRKQPKEEQK